MSSELLRIYNYRSNAYTPMAGTEERCRCPVCCGVRAGTGSAG